MLLSLAFLAPASPAIAQVIGPNLPATVTANDENEPQVAAFGNTLVAVWYREVLNRNSGWGYSLDGGATWTDGGAFPAAFTFGQPTVCVDNSGRFYAATIFDDEGWGIALYRGTTQSGGIAWEGPIYAAGPGLIAGNFLQLPLDAMRLTCDPKRGYLYLSYTRTRSPAIDQYEYTIELLRSLDGGTSWSPPQVLSSGVACNGSRPAVGPDGELYVVWEDLATRQVIGRRSTDFGAGFGPPFVVGEIRDNLGTPPPGWRPPFWRRHPLYRPPVALASDFPGLAVDRSTGMHRGRIYATWTDYAEGVASPASGVSYDVGANDVFAGATPIAIGDDVLLGFVQSVDMVPQTDVGDIYTFTGTAGTTIQVTGRVTNVSPFPSGPIWQSYALRCGTDTLQLKTVAIGYWAPEWQSVPPTVPAPLYTLPADGRYYLTTGGEMRSFWYKFELRAVTPLAGQAARDHRDIVLTWSDDGGATWVAKRRVVDAPVGYDESFPAVAVDEAGRVHLAWYDRRDDPGDCAEMANTYWTYSANGGESFAPSRRLSTQGSSWNFTNINGDSNIGDQLGLTTWGGRVHVLWTDRRSGGRPDIHAVRIEDVPTGIAVPRFTATAAASHVELLWTVADASGITGFRLHRATGGSEGFEALEETARPSLGPGEYRAEDHAVSAGRNYRYRLEVLRGSNPSDWEGPVEVVLAAPIPRLAWQRLSPNPFASAVRLELLVPRAGDAWARVYDLTGHEVATVYRGPMTAGLQTLTWQGSDRAGRRVPPGVYLVRADLAGESTTRRLVRME